MFFFTESSALFKNGKKAHFLEGNAVFNIVSQLNINKT